MGRVNGSDVAQVADTSKICTEWAMDASFTTAIVKSSFQFRWANEECLNGLPHPEELEYLGYVRVQRHPHFYKSWLMKREVESE